MRAILLPSLPQSKRKPQEILGWAQFWSNCLNGLLKKGARYSHPEKREKNLLCAQGKPRKVSGVFL
jgi:hypothetical protein